MKSVIYFLYQEDKIKIGKTTNLNQRIKSLTSTWGEFDLNKSFFIETNNLHFKLLYAIITHWVSSENQKNKLEKLFLKSPIR